MSPECYRWFIMNSQSKMKKSLYQPTRKIAVLAVAAVVLVGGSFALASGSIIESSNSLFASVSASISGKPIVFIGRDGASPKGNIPMGKNSALAIYDISARNVTHWATLKYVSIRTIITSAPDAPLSLSDITMSYNYCIPTGATYGYGYKSGGCGTIKVVPSSVTKTGNDYVVNFNGTIPVYPQQSYGAFTIYATPMYAYTATAKRAQVANARLQVRVVSAIASGDQCKWTSNPSTHAYGYTGCIAQDAIINIQAGFGNLLTVVRPYGYGYTGLK